MTNILITGGAGFIGSNLANHLANNPENNIIVVDNLDKDSHGKDPILPNFKEGIEVYIGDIRNKELMMPLLKRADVVYHLAAKLGISRSFEIPREFIENNTLGTEILIDLIKKNNERNTHKINQLIVASSNTVYGEGAYTCKKHGVVYPEIRHIDGSRIPGKKISWEPKCPICDGKIIKTSTPENAKLSCANIYAETKRQQEQLVRILGKSYNINTTILRFFNVYGPGQSLNNPYTGVASIFTNKFLSGDVPFIYEDGWQTRDFIFINDLVRGLEIVLNNELAFGQTFNLGTGTPTSIITLAETIAKTLNIDNRIYEITNTFREGDIRNCYADITKISSLGFKPQYRLEDGIQELVKWAKEERRKRAAILSSVIY